MDEQIPVASEAWINAWLDENWSGELTLGEWWQRLATDQLAFPMWPKPWGRAWSKDQLALRDRIFVERGILAPPVGLGTMMGGPVVLEFGTAEQQDRWLPDLINGSELWCQMFSEPDAGSDLAGLSTTAEKDGDEWVVNGQKVWTSLAPMAQRAMLVARTDWDLPKHRGLSYFILDMDTPGIVCRPLRQMNGESHFNEVFLTDVRIPDGDLLGGLNNGWAVAVSTLAHERRNVPSVRTDVPRPSPGPKANNVSLRVSDILSTVVPTARSTEEAGTAVALIELAGLVGRRDETIVRSWLAQQHIYDTLRGLTQTRFREEAKARGGTPGPESSVIKLARTQAMRHAQRLAFELLGSWGTLMSGQLQQHKPLIDFCLTVPSKSIAGGSDEIQRNLIAERALGLPKDPGIDTTSPFRDVPRGNTSHSVNKGFTK